MHLIVDCMNLVYRAHHASGHLTFPDGRPSGAAYGFLKSLLAFTAERKRRDRGALLLHLVWDGGRSPRRLALWPEYKAGRGAGLTPAQRDARREAFASQIPIVRDLCSMLGARDYRADDVEADDAIALLARALREEGVAILSGDHDFRQLVSDGIELVDPGKPGSKFPTGSAALAASSLEGDKSDNIPGVGGIGPVKSAALAEWFSSALAKPFSVESIAEALDSIGSGKGVENGASAQATFALSAVAKNRAAWERNVELMDLSRSMEWPEVVDAVVSGTRGRSDKLGLRRALQKLGFPSLLGSVERGWIS